MQKDLYNRVVLGLIAAGLWALAFTQLELPQARAAGGGPVAVSARATLTVGAAVQGRPLRWRVGYASHVNDGDAGDNECRTVISLLSAGPEVDVDVDFFDDNVILLTTETFTVPAGGSRVVITAGGGDGGNSIPFLFDVNAFTGEFLNGFALVRADDPRIQVAAFLNCKVDGVSGEGQDVRSTASIPAYPVGDSVAYFQAEIPRSGESPPVTPSPSVRPASR